MTGVLKMEDDTVCKHTITPRSGCFEKIPVTQAKKVSYTFSSCSTPIINSINLNNGTFDTEIKISGNGFSTKECQNEVKFGSFICNITSAHEKSLTCKIDSNSRPEIYVLHQLHARVNNRGFAQINISDLGKSGFAIKPSIKSITPIRGSLAGGARLTIKGYGFDGSPFITIGGYDCKITEYSYNEIICETPPSFTEERKQVLVFVYIGNTSIQSECKTMFEECTYSYNSSLTPVMLDVKPKVFSPKNPFTITGSLLGNITEELDVTFGNVSAKIIEANEIYVIAKVDNIPAGNNSVIIRVKDYGKALGKLEVHGPLIVNDLYPLSGSIYGNTTVTIFGNGFLRNNLTISFGDSNCTLLSSNLSHIICLTKPHKAGSVDVSLSSNGLTANYSSFRFTKESSPTVTSVSPKSGFSGDTLTISGSNLQGQYTSVSLNKAKCEVISVDTDEIKCLSGNHPTGKVNISVLVADLGVSNTDIQFEYQLSLLEITPTQGNLQYF
jgi:hypothetical protein